MPQPEQKDNAGQQVTGLALRLEGRMILVPNTAVAELIPCQQLQQDETWRSWPEAVMGEVYWRGLQLPLLSFERLLGGPVPGMGAESRILVFNTLQEGLALDFYAVLIQGIPRPLTLDASLLRADLQQTTVWDMDVVQLDGHVLFIPDLQALERWLLSA